jgi:hypothetical protein
MDSELLLVAAGYENGWIYVMDQQLYVNGTSLAMPVTPEPAAGMPSVGSAAASPVCRVLVALQASKEPLLCFSLNSSYSRGVAGGAGSELITFAINIAKASSTHG